MSNENIASIIGKVQKLLSLASNNTNENECKTARELADKLIQQYRLSMADIESKGGESESFLSRKVCEGGKRRQWVEVLLHALCQTYGGAFFFTSQRSGGCGGRGGGIGGIGKQSYTVIAQESDLSVIEYMLSYLCAEVDRLARWNTGGQGIAASNGFRSGCAAGISSQFSELRASMRVSAEAAGQSTALVLLDNSQELASAHMNAENNLTKGACLTGGTDYDSMRHGYSEGRKVNINRKGIESGNNNRQLG